MNFADENGVLTEQLQLKALDHLFIKRIPTWREERKVTLRGEVVFPGTYVLEESETLYSA